MAVTAGVNDFFTPRLRSVRSLIRIEHGSLKGCFIRLKSSKGELEGGAVGVGIEIPWFCCRRRRGGDRGVGQRRDVVLAERTQVQTADGDAKGFNHGIARVIGSLKSSWFPITWSILRLKRVSSRGLNG